MSLEMKYFVLKPRGNSLYSEASRVAMMVYAEVIERENPSLSADLRRWVKREEAFIAAEKDREVD